MDSNGQQSDSLKDNKCMENEKLVYNQLMRGKTPEDIKEQCLQLCQDYIAGDWIRQTVETIEVKRITGGLTNQLYKCSIITPEANTTVPNVVAIRIYGMKWTKNHVYEHNERLSDIIISVMVSEKMLGPKIFGIFNGGEITAFYKHRHFKLEEQKDAKLAEKLFRKMARIHAMNVPIKRKHWMLNEMDDNYQLFIKRSSIPQLIDELNCETLKTVNMSDEINWIKDKIIELGSPMVFSHNDLCSVNIMVLEDNEYNKSEDQILICDYEFASYGYRGQDIGSVINEWGRVGTDLESDDDLVDDNVIKQLLLYYIDENIKIFGKDYTKNINNSMDQLVKEVKVFALFNKINFSLFFLRTDHESDESAFDEKLSLKLAEQQFKNYICVI
ncbi:choline/ethanolamine kinase-like [Oppia nitens]|uniref:choline/ethanolamine kinase-like n=1 Tax=Oppia nitens TaxID=1686743 RepID=UPI0023D99CF5|nr:choline/ethanolamine kinase-like [Oppia nitens]